MSASCCMHIAVVCVCVSQALQQHQPRSRFEGGGYDQERSRPSSSSPPPVAHSLRHSPPPLRSVFGGSDVGEQASAASATDARREGYGRDPPGVVGAAAHSRPPPGSSFVEEAARDAAAAGSPVVGVAAARAIASGQGGHGPRWMISVGKRGDTRASSRSPSPRLNPSPAAASSGSPIPFEHAVGAVNAPRSPSGVRSVAVPDVTGSGGAVVARSAGPPQVRDIGHARITAAQSDWRHLRRVAESGGGGGAGGGAGGELARGGGSGYSPESMGSGGTGRSRADEALRREESRIRSVLLPPPRVDSGPHGPTGVALDRREPSRHRGGERGVYGVGAERDAVDAALTIRLPGRIAREAMGEMSGKLGGAMLEGNMRGAKRPRFCDEAEDPVPMEAAGAAPPPRAAAAMETAAAAAAAAAEGMMSMGATGIVEQRRPSDESDDSSD